MSVDFDRLTPVEQVVRRRRRIRLVVVLAVLAALVYYFVFASDWVIAHDREDEHFKYGSIGSEGSSGLPRKIFDALPVIYADRMGPRGWQHFGLIYEEGQDLPVGFSRRKVDGVERVWFNCSVCHMGSYTLPGDSRVHLIPGGASNELQLQELIRFFIDVGRDPGFNPDAVIDAINGPQVRGTLNVVERPLYRFYVVSAVKEAFLEIGRQLAFVEHQQDWGPGRVDTFNPYKAIQFNFPMGPEAIGEVALNGSADYPSIWQQAPREGMQLHWDGNNTSVSERNLSAALGAGVTPVTADYDAIKRVRAWTNDLPAPLFPLPGGIDRDAAGRGAELYGEYCAECHGEGKKDGYDYDRRRHEALGTVEPLSKIGTDPGRWAAYDADFAAAQNLLYTGTPVAFRHFRKTDGYANQPLDGIWARSPYLHNGSVPTLRDLLEPSAQRPKVWYRGRLEFDPVKVGYSTEAGDGLFRFDTSIPGNGNQGHEGSTYGTHLPEADKNALVEYMKTL